SAYARPAEIEGAGGGGWIDHQCSLAGRPAGPGQLCVSAGPTAASGPVCSTGGVLPGPLGAGLVWSWSASAAGTVLAVSQSVRSSLTSSGPISPARCVALHSSRVGSCVQHAPVPGDGADPSERPRGRDVHLVTTPSQLVDRRFAVPVLDGQRSRLAAARVERGGEVIIVERRSDDRFLEVHAEQHVVEEEAERPLVLLVTAGGAERQVGLAVAQGQAGRQRGARTAAGGQRTGESRREREHLA